MLVLQRNRGTFTGWIVGVLAVAGIVACFLIYGVEARRTRENFDDSLSQRADDVANVVLRPDGSLDTNALGFARDLNTAGIDVYLFMPDGTQIFAPKPQRVANLPALLPLRDAEAGGERCPHPLIARWRYARPDRADLDRRGGQRAHRRDRPDGQTG